MPAFVLQRRPLLVEPLPFNPAHLVHARVVLPGDGEPRVLDAGALVLGGDEVGLGLGVTAAERALAARSGA